MLMKTIGKARNRYAIMVDTSVAAFKPTNTTNVDIVSTAATACTKGMGILELS